MMLRAQISAARLASFRLTSPPTTPRNWTSPFQLGMTPEV